MRTILYVSNAVLKIFMSNIVQLSQALSRRWKNLPIDKVNFYRNLAMLDMKIFKTALETYNMVRIKTDLPALEI